MSGLAAYVRVLLLLGAASPAALGAVCPDLPVDVEASRASDRGEVCAAARMALDYLAPLGLMPRSMLRVRVADQPFEAPLNHLPGYYDPQTERIEVLSQRLILDSPAARILGLPAAPDLYRSLVIHEITHAVALSHGGVQPRRVAHEYIAFAVQLAALPETQRREIIGRAGVDGFENLDALSEAYLLIAPNRFAVKAYLHFSVSDDPGALVRELLMQRGGPQP